MPTPSGPGGRVRLIVVGDMVGGTAAANPVEVVLLLAVVLDETIGGGAEGTATTVAVDWAAMVSFSDDGRKIPTSGSTRRGDLVVTIGCRLVVGYKVNRYGRYHIGVPFTTDDYPLSVKSSIPCRTTFCRN